MNCEPIKKTTTPGIFLYAVSSEIDIFQKINSLNWLRHEHVTVPETVPTIYNKILSH
jgi:hypothetical protein